MSTAISSAFELNFRTPNTSVVGDIKYAIGRCVEGSLLVARSRIGICAIFLGEDARELQEQLSAAFPSHSLEQADGELRRDLGDVAAFIDKRSDDGMPGLDIGGTPFQQR